MVTKYGVASVVAMVALVGCAASGGGSGGDGGSGGEPWGGGGSGGAGSGAGFDLDTSDSLWLATVDGKSMVLYIYKGSASVFVDVRSTPKGATEGQYQGSRTGTLAAGYTLQLDCLNPGSSPVCDQFGTTMTMSCTSVAGSQLVCGSRVFSKVTSSDV